MNVLGPVTSVAVGLVCCGLLTLVGGAALVMGLNKRARPTTLSASAPMPPVQSKIEHPTSAEERVATPPPGETDA